MGSNAILKLKKMVSGNLKLLGIGWLFSIYYSMVEKN